MRILLLHRILNKKYSVADSWAEMNTKTALKTLLRFVLWIIALSICCLTIMEYLSGPTSTFVTKEPISINDLPDLTVCWELGGEAKKIPMYDEDYNFDYFSENGTNFDDYDNDWSTDENYQDNSTDYEHPDEGRSDEVADYDDEYIKLLPTEYGTDFEIIVRVLERAETLVTLQKNEWVSTLNDLEFLLTETNGYKPTWQCYEITSRWNGIKKFDISKFEVHLLFNDTDGNSERYAKGHRLPLNVVNQELGSRNPAKILVTGFANTSGDSGIFKSVDDGTEIQLVELIEHYPKDIFPQTGIYQGRHCTESNVAKEYKVDMAPHPGSVFSDDPKGFTMKYKFTTPTSARDIRSVQPQKTVMKDYWTISWIALVGNVGGTLGLFAGFAFCSTSQGLTKRLMELLALEIGNENKLKSWRKFIKALIGTSSMALAAYFGWQTVVEFMQGKTHYLASTELATLRDLPTVVICLVMRDFKGGALRPLIYGKSLKITATVYEKENKTVILEENKSIETWLDLHLHLSELSQNWKPDWLCFKISSNWKIPRAKVDTQRFRIQLEFDFLNGTKNEQYRPFKGHIYLTSEENSFGAATGKWFDGKVQWPNLVSMGGLGLPGQSKKQKTNIVSIAEVLEYRNLDTDCSHESYYACLAKRFQEIDPMKIAPKILDGFRCSTLKSAILFHCPK